jgi:aspartyl/asparaginyl-tRNA synthetase
MIDWKLLGEAVEHYKSLGFEYVETPWFVDFSTALITCEPHQAISYNYNDTTTDAPKSLVGSAEQGFLQLEREGKLDSVNYVSCGPCFRIEDNYTVMHLPQFMKVELYVRCSDENSAVAASRELVYSAAQFMRSVRSDIVKTDEGWDLERNGIEVGSYGARYDEEIGHWAYGTGLALPRFTRARDIDKILN